MNRTQAQLVCRIAGVLSKDTALPGLWTELLSLLATLVEAARIELYLDDRLVQRFDARAPTKADERTVSELRYGDSVIGSVVAIGPKPSDEALLLLDAVSLHVAARVREAQTREERRRFQALALTDGLTGIPNRRQFQNVIKREWKRAIRDAMPLCALMIDLDFFKSFNDTYGHQAGDRCLRAVAKSLTAAVRRPADVVARYGGEEFVALLPQTSHAGGISLAERFHESIRDLDISHSGSSLGRISMTIGVACVTNPAAEGSAAHLVQRADAALYRAKLAGRNRTHGDDYEGPGFAIEHVSPAIRPPHQS